MARQHGDRQLRSRFVDKAVSTLAGSHVSPPSCANGVVINLGDQAEVSLPAEAFDVEGELGFGQGLSERRPPAARTPERGFVEGLLEKIDVFGPSGPQAAASRYCSHASGTRGLAMRMKTVGPGALGLARSGMAASVGRRLPFLRLHGAHAATMLSQ